jgi:hypothetical protein
MRASLGVLALLLLAGCEHRDLTREEAIAAAEAYVDRTLRPNSLNWNEFTPIAYERRATWLVTFIHGGTGGPGSVELDKGNGQIVFYGGASQ